LTIDLRLGGMALALRCPESVDDEFLERARDSRTKAAAPDVVIDIRPAPDAAPPEATPRTTCTIVDGVVHHVFERRGFTLDLALTEPARAVCGYRTPTRIIENVCRISFSTLASLRGALVLHASAVATVDGAYVFTGPSGAGKTTAARLLCEGGHARLLAEELTVLQVGALESLALGTPFGGDLAPAPPDQAPLRRLFFLTPHGRPLTSAAGRLAQVLRNTVNDANDSELASTLLTTGTTLLATVDSGHLFHPTRGALQRALEE
jgi:hypothetical protein